MIPDNTSSPLTPDEVAEYAVFCASNVLCPIRFAKRLLATITKLTADVENARREQRDHDAGLVAYLAWIMESGAGGTPAERLRQAEQNIRENSKSQVPPDVAWSNAIMSAYTEGTKDGIGGFELRMTELTLKITQAELKATKILLKSVEEERDRTARAMLD